MNPQANPVWLPRDSFMETAISAIEDVEIILDIGPGIYPHPEYANSSLYICCEPFQEYSHHLREKLSEKIPDRIGLVLSGDWKDALELFQEKSVDTVYLLDVIEHLEKSEGGNLLSKTEKIARRQIVIFTPLGYMDQVTLPGGKDAWGMNGASWQEHKSGWHPGDFDGSWRIYACKDFHQINNVLQQLDKPIGAFWAMKTLG